MAAQKISFTFAPLKPPDTIKFFLLWLLALLLTVVGAKLWTIQLFGSAVPLWDQWFEARDLFKPWLAGGLTWKDYFAPYSEHRIFFTRVFDIGLISLNGRWDVLLQMTANTFIHAIYIGGLAFALWHLNGRNNGWLICFLLMPFFALPYAAENAIWAFNSQEYFLAVFSLATLAGLGFSKPGHWKWWAGFIAAIAGLFTMASGLLAPLAVAGLAILRTLKSRRIEKENIATFCAAAFVVSIGSTLTGATPNDQPLRAHSIGEFAAALLRNLEWPFYNSPLMAGVMALPLILLLANYFRPAFQKTRAAEFLLLLALWSFLQACAFAYGRANFGESVPASRYMDALNVFVIAAVFAALLLAQQWQWSKPALRFLPPIIFIALVLFGVCRISKIVVNDYLISIRTMNLIAGERVEKFMATGDEKDLLQPPTVRPDPKVALAVLRDKTLQTILPASCFPPSSRPAPGFPAVVARSFLSHSFALTVCGLALFTFLLCFGMARMKLGLAREDLGGIAALLVLLLALGFLWTNRQITRTSLESKLQQQLADYFRSVNNPERAAAHEQKAESLQGH